MYVERFYHRPLAQASYLVGCQATGEALIVDPNRDLVQYQVAAAREGLHITHVTETHIHADFVSGACELAQANGAQLLVSGMGGDEWQYAFAAEPNVRLLRDGDRIAVGNLAFDVIHTPGHTPEHLSFLVTDEPAAAGPIGLFTGDFLFVGDVGRPDLLEVAVGRAGTMESAARDLFASLQRIGALPDHLQVWPGHGAGSACGKSLGAVPTSTLGYERLANWALRLSDPRAFVATVLAGQPEPPKYFANMKRMNQNGPAHIDAQRPMPRISPVDADGARQAGATLVDVRPSAKFASGHLPGALNIPWSSNFLTWAGSVVSYNTPIILVAAEAAEPPVAEITSALSLIGLDAVAGFTSIEPLATTPTLAHTQRMTPREFVESSRHASTVILDIRQQNEWDVGHIGNAIHIPLAELAARIDELPRNQPIAVHCQSGARSAVAVSLLQASGFADSTDLLGGFTAWCAAALPVVTDRAIAAPAQTVR